MEVSKRACLGGWGALEVKGVREGGDWQGKRGIFAFGTREDEGKSLGSCFAKEGLDNALTVELPHRQTHTHTMQLWCHKEEVRECVKQWDTHTPHTLNTLQRITRGQLLRVRSRKLCGRMEETIVSQ